MEELSLSDYLAILKWRKKYFFLTFIVLWAVSLVFALSWSNYRSSTTVEIEQPQIAADATSSNPNGESSSLADLRINKIEQKVTAPASLVDIISKFNLYSAARRHEPIASIADRMRNKIKLNLIGSTVANPTATQKVSVEQLSAIAFTLSFDYKDPQIAQQVTNELVTRFLDEDLKQRRAEAEETSAFLATQITAMEATMADQEKNIAKFQEEHGVSRPEILMFNQQAAASTLMTIQSIDSQLSTNEGTQGSIRAQLATVDPYSRVIADGQVLTTPATQLKAMEGRYTSLTAQYGPSHPDVIKLRHQIDALREDTGLKNNDTAQLKAQIADLKTNLTATEETSGPENPDTVALKHQLKNLEKQLASAGTGMTHAAIQRDADNPAYLQLVAQLNSAEEQRKSLVEQRKELTQQQAKYQQAVTANPGLQQQMATLSRDYDNAQLRYRALKERKMAADMDVQLVQERKGQRLVVIDPPNLPVKTQPSRLLIMLAGFLLSVMGGVGAVILAQAMSGSVLGVQRLTSLVGVPPLVMIPHIYNRREINRIRRRKPLLISATILLAAIAIVVFNFAIMPVDVLWSTVALRLGLS